LSAEFLLDVNVLLARFVHGDAHHARVKEWMVKHEERGWATCPITQMGFVRILSNPSATQESVAPSDAVKLLNANLQRPEHEFWADDLTFPEALAYFEPWLTGHRQTTDAYLLGLAMHRKGKLVTFDRGMLHLAGESAAARAALIVI